MSDRRSVPGADILDIPDMTISAGIAGATALVDFVQFDDVV